MVIFKVIMTISKFVMWEFCVCFIGLVLKSVYIWKAQKSWYKVLQHLFIYQFIIPTSDHGVAGSNPAGGEILPEPKRRFIA